MSISIRHSIRWLPGAPSEPTSTVVLTSPEHRFVDVRILKDTNEPDASLDWAFAGISSSEIRNGVRHCIWRHLVDSRTAMPIAVVDEGDIFPQDNGQTLETGRMMNPATEKLADYEEMWTDLEPEGIPEGNKNSGELIEQWRGRCVVLELEDEHQGRGMAVCLGRYYQGVVRIGQRFAAERWLWEDGEWRRKFRVGDLWIPGPEHMYSDTLSQGEQIRLEDTHERWRVVEMSYS
ncbi:hypothetical protein ANO14919_145320 [Xylariales sp. No.14919]|nr:hypothetical protein F5X98DRAFT_50344 [Xylaria grammica]GAW24936.1 hypothetical protein ANO14919_145320 [Xylariales sp. No.14919]